MRKDKQWKFKHRNWVGTRSQRANSCLPCEHAQAVTMGPFLGVLQDQQCQHTAQFHASITSPFNKICTYESCQVLGHSATEKVTLQHWVLSISWVLRFFSVSQALLGTSFIFDFEFYVQYLAMLNIKTVIVLVINPFVVMLKEKPLLRIYFQT